MKKKDKGITLIALVITIIILLILALVSINLLLGENGIIKKSKIASTEYKKEDAKEKLELVLADLQIEKLIKQEYNEQDYINNRLIENKMKVEGNIVTVDEWQFEIDRKLLKIVQQGTQITIGEVISAENISNNPSKYYGKEVNYSTKKDLTVASVNSIKKLNLIADVDEQLKSDGIKWQIFYSDNEHIYLITTDFVKVDGNNYYKVFDTAEQTLEFINNKSNWEEYVGNNAEYAIGGPTFTMFQNSWNAKYPNNVITGVAGDEENGWSVDCVLNNKDGLYFKNEKDNYGYWLASKNRNGSDSRYLVHVDNYGRVSTSGLAVSEYGEEANLRQYAFRPIVCLNKDIELQYSTDGFIIVNRDETLASRVQIGDYVSYNALAYDDEGNPYSYTSPKGSGQEHGNGYKEQIHTTNSDIKWRVLSKNISSGEVVLISEKSVKRDVTGYPFYMKGAIAALYAEEELNRIASIYGHGYGANTSKVFTCETGDPVEGLDTITLTGSGARSVTADDINNIIGFEKNNSPYSSNYGDTIIHTVGYATKKTLDGISTEEITRTDIDTSYSCYPTDYLNKTSTMYELLFGELNDEINPFGYWLASRAISGADNSLYYTVGKVNTTSRYNSDTKETTIEPCMFMYTNMFGYNNQQSDKFSSSGIQCGVRPIVYLKNTLKTNGKDENGAWIIVDE